MEESLGAQSATNPPSHCLRGPLGFRVVTHAGESLRPENGAFLSPSSSRKPQFSCFGRPLCDESMEDRKELLTEIPVAGIIRKNGEKYITELDETKTKIVDRYRVGKQIGKVRAAAGEC